MYGNVMLWATVMLHTWLSDCSMTHSIIECCINCIYLKHFDHVNISSSDMCECGSNDNTEKVPDQKDSLQKLHFTRSTKSTSVRDHFYTLTEDGCFVSVRNQTNARSSIPIRLKTIDTKTTTQNPRFISTRNQTASHKPTKMTTEKKSITPKASLNITGQHIGNKTRKAKPDLKQTVKPKLNSNKTESREATPPHSPTETPEFYDEEYIDEKPNWPEMKHVPCFTRRDCATLLAKNPKLKSGIYKINPGDGGGSFKASCDMKRFGGGWTVIQRRKDGSESFYRTHKEYAEGFGSLKREFWLGNDRIHRLVKEPSLLIFDLMDFKRNNRYQVYDPFYVGSKDVNYKIELQKSFGTAGDSLTASNGYGFSTKDRDSDFNMFISCAKTYGGGWWYKNCEEHLLYYEFLGANVNGKYKGENAGLSWRTWNKHQTKLKVTEMKIRAKSFYRDCGSLRVENKNIRSGLHTINPGDGLKSFKVYCDMETDGGGWTVLQNRYDGSENFDKPYKDYESGFGHLKGEFWLGLVKLRRLASETPMVLRFDMTDHNNENRYALYDGFSVGNSSTWYTINFGRYSGNAGNYFGASNNRYFQSKDKKSKLSLCPGFKGGWWYKTCRDYNINGLYGNKKGFGMIWKTWHGLQYSLKRTQLKIRHATGGVDCDILKKEGHKSGFYHINPDWKGKFKVYCNMSVDGHGWMVVQRRLDGAENFWRKWNEYKQGFGNMEREFWIGNEYLHRTTGNTKHILRFDMEDFDGDTRYAIYKGFSVDSEAQSYRLSVGSYCGNAGDSLTYHNRMKFSAIDRDNDAEANGECSKLYNGGWWYKKCHEANPNGKYDTDDFGQGVIWKRFRGMDHSIKYIEMKIRRE